MGFGLLEHLVSKLENRTSPLWGQFELLPVCNLKCGMCYVHTPENDHRNFKQLLPASFWIDVAKQAVDMGMLVLSITGGETLLYPDLDFLLSELSRMGLIISFNTNGTLIDEKQAERLAKYSLSKINISLYGASDKTYEIVTGCADGFSSICKAIDVLQGAEQNVYLNGVLVPGNQDDLSEMLSYAASKGLVLHETAYIFPRRHTICGYDPNEFRLSPEDAAKISSRYKRLMEGDIQYRQQAAFAAFRDHTISNMPERIPRMGKCGAGQYEFAVDWRGNLQPCVLLNTIQEDLKGKGFAEAWENCVERMQELPQPEKCMTCSHLDLCPVCCASTYLETGKYDEAPEYLCRYSEELLHIFEKDSTGITVRIKNVGEMPMDGGFKGCKG